MASDYESYMTASIVANMGRVLAKAMDLPVDVMGLCVPHVKVTDNPFIIEWDKATFQQWLRGTVVDELA